MKNNLGLRLFTAVFTGFGALFLLLAAVLAVAFGILKSSRIKTEAVITGAVLS